MKTRQTFNYHTHTSRCGHAVGDDEAYIQAAIDGGFKILGFSEHLGYDGWDDANERIPFLEIDAYLETMNGYKEKYKDQIDLRIGFEFEYFEEDVDFLRKIKEKCDYMINGQHAKNRIGYGYYYHDQCSDEDVLIYANQVCKAIELGLTDYLAHPDYFMLGRKEFNSACAQAMEQIAVCAKAHNIPVEINLKGMRYGKKQYPYGERFIYPHRETYEIFAKHQCKLVYGYDAHHPDVLKDHEKQAWCDEVLEGLDIEFIKDLNL